VSDQQPGLLARTARGAFWVVVWRLLTRTLGLLSTLVLVRLLTPEDFGLVALATAFAFAIEAGLAFGIEAQLVRMAAPDRAAYDTAFTLALLRGVLLGALVAGFAPAAAEFFREPRLEPILYALAAATAASGLQSTGVIEFRRTLDFQRELRLQLPPRIAGILITIGLALALGGPWALVAGIVVQRVGVIAMGYAMHPFRPRLSLALWREFAAVSFWNWAIGICAILRDRADSMMVGRLMGMAPVGILAAGTEIAMVPTSELGSAVNRAAMSGFAEAGRAGDGERERDLFLRILAGVLFITLPAAVGTSLVADPVVRLALGSAWAAATPVVAILGAGSAFIALGYVCAGWLQARTPLRLLCCIFGGALILRVGLLLALTPPFGLAGAAGAVAAAGVAEFALLLAATARALGIGARALVTAGMRPMLATASMSAAVLVVGGGWVRAEGDAQAAFVLLLSCVCVGAVTYLATSAALWLAAGRPDGPEHDVLRLLAQLRRARVSRAGG
jgi:O-antigen/teichoic acid export membrane protein